MSIEVLKEERQRIDKERADARRVTARATIRYTDLREIIDQALDLAQDWQTAYLQAPNRVRRLLNQAFFERIDVDDDEATAQMNEAYLHLKQVSVLNQQVTREVRQRRRYERQRQTETTARAWTASGFRPAESTNPDTYWGRGSRKHIMVDLRRHYLNTHKLRSIDLNYS